MGVGVAGGTITVFKIIRHSCRQEFILPELVARVAQDGTVGSFEGKATPHVTGQGKSRRFESFRTVAVFAFVLVGLAPKLAPVDVVMTGGAVHHLGGISGRSSTRNVAFRAGNGSMFVAQREHASGVLCPSEGGWLESLYRMTGAAIAPIGACSELTLVIVLPVAVQAT